MMSVFIVIAVLVIASFGITAIPSGGQRASSAGSSDRYIEGVGTQQTLMPAARHVDGQPVNYSTTPPTSGDHWSNWASCGFYDEGLPDERVVHNLEHSAIVVSYNLATSGEVNQLRDAVGDIGLSRIWGVTRFYDKIPQGTVALATWGVLDTMEGVNQERIKKFFETYAGRLGPEKSGGGVGIPC